MIRSLKWLTSAIALALLAAWLVAGFSGTSVLIMPGASPPYQAVLAHGGVEWVVARPPPTGGSGLFGAYHLKSEFGPHFDPGLRLPRVERVPGVANTISIPLWIPLALALVAAATLWRLDRRRPASGRCANCGYDLTLNVSGKCPECGKPCPVNCAAPMR